MYFFGLLPVLFHFIILNFENCISLNVFANLHPDLRENNAKS
jgi:hypothetical protein